MVDLTITIPDEHWQRFKNAFIEAMPVPINGDTGQPEFNDRAWIRHVARMHIRDIARRGEQMVNDRSVPQAPSFDDFVR